MATAVEPLDAAVGQGLHSFAPGSLQALIEEGADIGCADGRIGPAVGVGKEHLLGAVFQDLRGDLVQQAQVVGHHQPRAGIGVIVNHG